MSDKVLVAYQEYLDEMANAMTVEANDGDPEVALMHRDSANYALSVVKDLGGKVLDAGDGLYALVTW